jgi:glycosyltransferase involved in cell wall biosynthesis
MVINSTMIQIILPTEIIIADDVSIDETKSLIEKFKQKTSIPIHNIWYEDFGVLEMKDSK